MSRASVRRGLRGFETISVRVGPTTRSTRTTMPTTCSTLERYQPGQRYQPSHRPPSTKVSAQALPSRCRLNTLRRNRIYEFSPFGGDDSVTRFSGVSTLSPGIACFSESQPPRSIRRQRSLQKGRKGALSQSRSRWHVGHLMRAGLTVLSTDALSGAAAQHECDIVLRLGGARGDPVPGEEA